MKRADSDATPHHGQDASPGDRTRKAIKAWGKPKWLVGAGALAVLVGAAGASQLPPPATCKVDQPIARGTGTTINMTVRAGGTCTVVIRSAGRAVSTLQLQAPPKTGALRRRGNTGVIYRVGRDFKGRDSFSFSIARDPSGHSDATTYHVDVNVI